MSRSLSQTSAAAGTSTNGLSRSLSVKTNTRTAQSNPLPPSDIKLFVTNLRLLDLDLRSDWPNISVQTFSSKNADQKQRIGAVEWSLFRLFEIWEPVETSQKLQPFFPPLEPLQSRNLRIALHRSLDALKKDGVLGRESVLRKTMLDECKGDKFFEILALFSSAVLKKVVSSRRKDKRKLAIARKLATAPTLSSGQQESLLPLAIAHKAVLANGLRSKNEKRARFAQLEQLLDTKHHDINQRIQKSKDTPRARKPAVEKKEADAIKKQLEENWTGNSKWLDAMLHEDHVQANDALLKYSFTQAWHTVERGRKLEDTVSEMGPLERLQLRAEEQQARLKKWKLFQEKMQAHGASPSLDPKQPPASAREFKFNHHLQFQIRSKAPNDEPVERPRLRAEYQDILSGMDDELLRVAASSHTTSTAIPLRRRGSSLSASRSPGRRRKSRSDSIPKVPASPAKASKPAPASRKLSRETMPPPLARRQVAAAATPIDSEATLVGHASTLHNAALTPQTVDSVDLDQDELEPPEETSDSLPLATSPPHTRAIEPASPSPYPAPPSSYFPSEPPILEPTTLDPSEALAAQIISSIGDATPSPTKKPQPRLSLLERTRMSMARTTSFDPVPESPSLPSPPLPEPPTAEPDMDRRQTLLERTRLSMAAMSQKPRASLAPKEKRKSTARQSIYPVNQFDTPRNRKSFQAIEEARSGEHTPKEDLFSEDIEYDKVFKSRPRIATSPVWGTPRDDADEAEEEYDEGVTGVDLADVDAEDDDGITQAWEYSPSRRVGGRRVYD